MERRPYRGRGRGRGRGRERRGRGRQNNHGQGVAEADRGQHHRDGQHYRRGREAERDGAANNGGREHGRQNRNDRPVRPIGYKMLEEIAALEPSETVHRLAGYRKGLEKLIQESEIRFDLMIQLTSALAKACSCKTSQETLMGIVVVLQAENFLTNHLAKFVREWPHKIGIKADYKEVIPNLLGVVIIILSTMLAMMQSLFNDVGICLLCLDDSVGRCGNSGVVFPTEVTEKLDELKDYQETIANDFHDRQIAGMDRYSTTAQNEEVEPEDDFRELPIFPIAKELQEGHRPFLRKNVVNKGYNDIHHYLDIQFRLLREDFVAPLRKGITEYRSLTQNKEGKQQVRLQDIYVYHDVQVLEAKPFDDGIVYITRFNVDHLSRVQWERSRRLLFGSLLCLSSDDFEHVIFAVVVNRKPEALKEGLIELKFHGAAEILPTLFSTTYTMAESSAYFEAYRHVLKRIQAITEETFPLEKYIIRADPRPELPYYLRRDPYVRFDLTPVAKPQRVINPVVAAPRSWPPLHEFDLDSSQLEAFRAALTEELCCIQGPPGTGKTFIGLKIVETLLRNKRVWSPEGDTSPILLICFTNHALDQFLEGILEFLPEGIVRIGGRSSSDKLKDLNLKELRRNRSRLKKRPKHQYLERKNIRDEMLDLAKRMQNTQKSIKTANAKILKDTKLKDVIPREQYLSILNDFHTEEAPNLKSGEYIAFWLGAIGGGADLAATVSDEEDNSDLHTDIAPPLIIKPDNKTGRRRQRRRQRHDILEGRPLQEYISQSLRVMDQMSDHEYTAVGDVWNLDITNRWRLYRYWLAKHQDDLQRLLRVANRAILKMSILQPFMKPEQCDSLLMGMPGNVQQEQYLGAYLGVLQHGWTAEFERRIGLVDVVEIQDENGLIVMMQDYMENNDETCRMNISRQMMLLIAKGLTQIGPMNKHEADQVRDVTNLNLYNRWRLYKYWVTLYCRKLQECLTVSRSNVLREDIVRHQMTADQIESFFDDTRDDNFRNIDRGQLTLLWLRAYGGVPIADVQAAIGNLPQEDGDIDIVGEAEMLNEERFLDDGNDEELNEALEDIVEDDEDDDGVNIFGRNADEDNQGWQVAGKDRRGLRKYVNKNLRQVQRMSEERARNVRNVWELPMNQRWNLYRYWLHIYKEQTENAILPLQEEYEKQARLMREVKMEEDVDLIRDATIIALTTTGASKYHYLIQRVHPRIVIVEEAAEVLEAHIVTSLTEQCQHLILIGDHQQLRPNPTVYELAKDYHLDISLFERLIKNNFPRHRLKLQHRMRPEISLLLKIREEFYPDLEDHASVLKYESVRGIEKDVFFLDHTHVESSDSDNRSKSNKFEAEFLSGLCRYLLQQEYLPEQITILTAYTGQLWNFKQCMPKSVFGNVRVCPVDRYQGEENDIILLSLVRSNEKGSIGFLKIANRVCVALSRAKKGLYCVGNFSLLSDADGNNLWREITECLRNRRQLGRTMTLRCSNHPEVTTEVKIPKDFTNVPEGGCTKPCETRLECGHVCPMICHPRNADHIGVKCKKKCTKIICDLSHQCKKMCYQVCDQECKEKINTELDCGHVKKISCHLRISHDVQCTEPCMEKLKCGHPCTNRCGEGCSVYCKHVVRKQFKCGHRGETECGNKEENCPEPCGENLKCGHPCTGTCGKCKQGRLHVPCSQPCGRTLVCGHPCKSTCMEYCPPCGERCQNRCIHSKCVKKCGQLCTPCKENCEWTCDHAKCDRPCGEPCTRPPCDRPCRRRIPKCGHECIGICGERCPTKCRICHEDEVTEIMFGDEDEPDARFVQLEDCKHIIEVKALDTWLEQVGEDDSQTVQVKVCPKCKTAIRRNLRYSNAIKQARADVEHIKKRLLGDPVAIREKRAELLQELSEEDSASTGGRDLNRLMTGLVVRDVRELTEDSSAVAFTGKTATGFVKLFRDQISSAWTDTQITSFGYKMNMFKRLCEMKRKSKKIEDRKGNAERRILLDRFFDDVLRWLSSLSYISEQNTEDWNTEIRRISSLIKLMEARLIVSVTRYPAAGEIIKKIYLILSAEVRYSDRSNRYISRLFEELRKYASGLGVSEEEKNMIVKAVGLAAGHWYKCRNGHFYAIGECGGATERGRCPECQEEIGGENHRLVSTNRHAPEMDGSRHAAWSEGANMANFDPREFL